MSGTEEFVHRTREGFYAGLTLFLVFPAMGVAALLEVDVVDGVGLLNGHGRDPFGSDSFLIRIRPQI